MPHGTVTIITIKKPTNTSLINIDVIIKKSKTFAPCFLHQRHDRITRGFVQAGLTPIFSSFCIIVLLVVIEHLFFKALPSQSPKTMVAMRITTDHRRTYGAKAIRQVRPQRETGCRRLSRTQGPKRHTVPAAGPCPMWAFGTFLRALHLHTTHSESRWTPRPPTMLLFSCSSLLKFDH